MLLAANGLRMALTTPDTRLVTAVTMGGNGFGVGTVASFALGVARDNAWVVAIRSGLALAVGSASLVSWCVAVGDPWHRSSCRPRWPLGAESSH